MSAPEPQSLRHFREVWIWAERWPCCRECRDAVDAWAARSMAAIVRDAGAKRMPGWCL
jgi:hypothetical protein